MRADWAVCFLGAVLLLTLPLKWLLAAVLAAAFHEFCHFLAIRLLGGQVYGIKLSIGGAAMETGVMSPGREMLCALAGPTGSLLLVCLFRWLPRTALCAFFHAAYNLLPIYPLDGGRALECIARLLAGKWAERICRWVEWGAIGAISALAVWACFWLHMGILPLLFAAFLIIKALARKIPCKPPQLGVQ